jgi:hypothetical protein
MATGPPSVTNIIKIFEEYISTASARVDRFRLLASSGAARTLPQRIRPPPRSHLREPAWQYRGSKHQSPTRPKQCISGQATAIAETGHRSCADRLRIALDQPGPSPPAIAEAAQARAAKKARRSTAEWHHCSGEGHSFVVQSFASSVPSEAGRLAAQRHRYVAAHKVIDMLGQHPRHEL